MNATAPTRSLLLERARRTNPQVTPANLDTVLKDADEHPVQTLHALVTGGYATDKQARHLITFGSLPGERTARR